MKKIKKIGHIKGQIIIGALAVFLVAGILLVMLFNNGLALREKTQLIDAADAAAYSEGVITARRLNFMAYTNRAVVANHLAAGHAVIYMSWIRHATTTWQANNDFYKYGGFFNPHPGPFVRIGMNVLLPNFIQDLAAYQTDVQTFLSSINAANQSLSAGQQDVLTQAVAVNADVRNLTVAQFDTDSANRIRVNDVNDIANTVAQANNVGNFLLANELNNINNEDAALTNFLQMADNTTAFLQMSAGAIDANNPNQMPSSAWFNARDWRTNLAEGDGRVKTFTTAMNGTDWTATDTVRNGSEVYSGAASALNLLPTYAPFANPYAVLPLANGVPITPTLTRTVLVAKNLQAQDITVQNGGQRQERGLRSFDSVEHRGGEPVILTAHARAEVFYQRPQPGVFDTFAFATRPAGSVEYANLYNPFWQVRLSAVPSDF
jgi:hypothetical protein